MQDVELLPPVKYGINWFIVGLVLIAMLLSLVLFILWVTRKKKLMTIANLSAKEFLPKNLDALKKKYLDLLNQVEQGYLQKKYSARSVHQLCSRTLRMFIYEASGFRAHVMTLSDLKLSRYPEIGKIIADYYPPEFARAESTAIEDAILSARKAIESWV